MDGGRVPDPLSVPEGLDRKVTSPYAFARHGGSTSYGSRSPEGDTLHLRRSPAAAAGCLLRPSVPWVVRAELRGAGVPPASPQHSAAPVREHRGCCSGPFLSERSKTQ